MELGEYEYHCREGDRDWWQVGMRACTLAAVPAPARGPALDLGAGCGYFVRDLTAAGMDARGVELSEYAVACAERIGAAGRVQQGRLEDHLSDDLSLDLVSLLDVLPHREVDEPATLAAMAGAVRPGGHVLLRLPAYRWLYGSHDRFVHQVRRYDQRDVAPPAARPGLEGARATFPNCALSPAVLAAHVRERLRRDAPPASSNQRLPGPINTALRAVLLAEAALIRRGVKLPWGSSLLV